MNWLDSYGRQSRGLSRTREKIEKMIRRNSFAGRLALQKKLFLDTAVITFSSRFLSPISALHSSQTGADQG
jgi:hypothetical protein